MAETVHCCSGMGCSKPGTLWCSGCKTKFYCGSKCQTADWPQHKEECEGRLRKQGMAYYEKAKGYHHESPSNYPQALHYADLAVAKLNQLKDRPVEIISDAMNFKFFALNFMDQNKEALECAKEWYCLWLTKHTHPTAIKAAFALIESCLHNKEYADARLYAFTTWETLPLNRNSHIPEGKRQWFIAEGAYYLARAILALAETGGIPAEEKQKAGEEAIKFSRMALETHSQLYGPESCQVAGDMALLADVLGGFGHVDDEITRLYEQAVAIYARAEGRSSLNVAIYTSSLAVEYTKKATRAFNANDLDRHASNLELALLHYREAARIHRSNNHVDRAERNEQMAAGVEMLLQQKKMQKTRAAAASAAATKG